MKAAVLFSGGKDSTLALFHALNAGYIAKYLITLFPRNPESYMFHKPDYRIAIEQAKLMGIPMVRKATSGEKEKELADLEAAIEKVKGKIECVVTGAVASEYQRSRVHGICRKLGLAPFSPLWHTPPERLWDMLLGNGFRVVMTQVACDGLGKEWLGAEMTPEKLAELKALSARYKFNLAGEGGEFETLVVDCPLFAKPLELGRTRIEWDEKTSSGSLVFMKPDQ